MDTTSLVPSPVQVQQAQTSGTRLAGDFDTFLKLLTTQLQNQDPLDPLDTEKFTEQLVQFAGVEQSIQTNTQLATLIDLQSSSRNENALSLIGREVSISGDTAQLTDKGAVWRYTFSETPSSASARVLDENGNEVRRVEIKGAAGSNDFVWDGRTTDGTLAQAGTYRLEINTVRADDSAGDVSIDGITTVTGVVFNLGNTELETPIGLRALDDVTRVRLAR